MKEFLQRTKDTHKGKEYFLNEMAYTIGPFELKKLLETRLDEFNLFDVRNYEEYIKGHIPFAMHIPFEQLDEQMVQFSKDKINILYSQSCSCHLAAKCAYLITDKGYPAMILTGGYKTWKKHDFDIVEDDVSDYPG